MSFNSGVLTFPLVHILGAGQVGPMFNEQDAKEYESKPGVGDQRLSRQQPIPNSILTSTGLLIEADLPP